MTPEQIDRVFGRGRLQMVTGRHVEVFREAVGARHRRKYTKRFLHTLDADFGQWTEREWRILARLIGHGIDCVPEVVQFDRGAAGGTQLVQTYDAGATVDQWATILPVARGGHVQRHVFEDCAHWWALAHHCLRALAAIHELAVVHLDIKGDNVCIPVGPPEFDPHGDDLRLHPRFDRLALIDFAFSLVSGERLTSALPIGWQTDYDYQSPRLLHALDAGRRGDLTPTRELDWRCDMYSLAAMLKRYLPDEDALRGTAGGNGWTVPRAMAAKELVLALREAHDRTSGHERPHAALLALTGAQLAEPDLEASLAAGWTLARDAQVTPVAPTGLTPLTRLAPTLRAPVTPRVVVEREDATVHGAVWAAPRRAPATTAAMKPRRRVVAAAVLATVPLAVALAVTAPDLAGRFPDGYAAGRAWMQRLLASDDGATRAARTAAPAPPLSPMTAPDASGAAVTSADATAQGAAPVIDTPPAPAAASPAEAPGAAEATTASANGDAAPPGPAAATASSRASSVAMPGESTPTKPVVQAHTAPAVEAARPTPRAAATAGVAPGVRGAAGTRRLVEPPSGRTRVAASAPAGVSGGRALAHGRTTSSSSVASVLAEARPGSRATAAAASAARVKATPVAVPAPARVRFFDDLPPRAAPTVIAAPASDPQPSVATVESPAAPPAEAAATAPTAPAPAAPSAPAARAKPAPAAAPAPRGILAFLLDFAHRGDGGRAPVEERSAQASPARPHAAPPPRSAPPTAPAPPANANVAPTASPTPPAIAGGAPTVPPDPLAIAGTPSDPAPAATAPRLPAPRPTPLPAAAGERGVPPNFALQAQRSLQESVPYSAARVQPEVARVLAVAAQASPAQERSIVDAVRQAWPSVQVATSADAIDAASGRQLNDDARQAFVVERNPRRAFDLQMRAFGANPRDPEAAGNLAFLYLRMRPAQPERARELVLHALALSSPQHRVTRVDDWNTLAVASALTGREADAVNAFYVALALTRDLDRSCKAALSAVDTYGDPLVAPVQAMLTRIRQQGRSVESPYCAWPVHWRTARG